jgi:transcription antitermination factor NusG
MFERSKLSWFALRVRSRHEKVATAILEGKGFEPFLPLYRARRKWTDRQKDIDMPMFPGYVFCRFNPVTKAGVLETPGVVDIVGVGRTMAEISDGEIEALRRVVQHRMSCEPVSHLVAGETVRIDDGPLSGLEGKVVEVKKSLRLVLSVTLLQRSVLVEIDPEWVTPIES